MAKNAPDFGSGPAPKRHPNMRPKHAATMIVADVSGAQPKFLMGERSQHHVFMPGFFVFPGGRLERRDYRADLALNAHDAQRMSNPTLPSNIGDALLHCAVRETLEETGLDVSRHAREARYTARAITPPGQVRRFDTRFFMMLVDSRALPAPKATDGELLRVDWLTVDAMPENRIHRITGLVLQVVLQRLSVDPTLEKIPQTPVYRFRHGKPVVEFE